MSEELGHAWERELRLDIADGNAALRAQGHFRLGSVDWESIFQTADDLGIDRERVEGIVRAARADVDWHEAVGLMVARGLDRQSAAEVVRLIVASMHATRIMADAPLNEARERRELAWSIMGLCAMVLGGALAAYYWSSVSYAWRLMRACVLHIFFGDATP